MFEDKIVRKSNKIDNVKKLFNSNSSLLYGLYCGNRLKEIVSNNLLSDNNSKLVCIYFAEPIISNFDNIVKVTNTLFGFKDSTVILKLNIIFVYSDGSTKVNSVNIDFIEYNGYRAKDKESLIKKYTFDNNKFKSDIGVLNRYDKLHLTSHHLDYSLKFIRDCLLNNKFFEPFFVFNNDTLKLFVSELKENKDRKYVSLLKENSDLTNKFINETTDEKSRNRLINLFNRFERIFQYYKDTGFYPDETYNMFSFYKLELGWNKGFIYTNGFTSYYVTYKEADVKITCIYDLYKGSKVSDCIKVLEGFTRFDDSGMLELLKINMDLRKKELVHLDKFKREWDYKIRNKR